MRKRKSEVDEKQLTGTPLTAAYEPAGYTIGFYHQRQRPIFMPLIHVPMMLPDARIQFGLGLIRGAIKTLAKPTVECNESSVGEFLQKQVDRFWCAGLTRALRCLEWGWSANEILYQRNEEGLVEFKGLKDIQSPDAKAVAYQGKLVGCTISGLHANSDSSGLGHKFFMGGPKLLWSVYRRDLNQYYGQSRLYGAFNPWWEKWSEGGFRDMRRLWYYKNAFRSPIIRHPDGSVTLPDGSITTHKEIARSIGEWLRSGFQLTLPSTKDAGGNFLWEIEDAKGNDTPGGLLDYGGDINAELFEGLGIPEEVVASEAYGFGSSSGRSVPMIGFLSSLHEIAEWTVADLKEQCLETLVYVNFKKQVPFEIKIPSLVENFMPFEPVDQNQDTGESEPGSEEDQSSANNGNGFPGGGGKKPGKNSSRRNGNEEKPQEIPGK